MLDGIKILLSHGLSGYLILGAGIFCLVVAADRIRYLFFEAAYESTETLKAAKESVLKRKYSTAFQLCNQEPNNPELKVLKEGLLAVENGREAMKSALSGAVMEVSRDCEKRLSFLSLVASSATLLGLFGTIMGLIKTFGAIAGADPAAKAKLLGMGISEAMYSTAAGVIVGVFAMVIHTICVSKADSITGKVQKVALDFSNWVEFSERSGK